VIYRIVIGSYLAQAYVTLIGIILMPVYLHILGASAFGLVGFYLMLQSWVQLLDLGISPTFSREMARYRAGMLTAGAALLRLRTLELMLGGLAVLAVCALILGRNWIARDWLQSNSIGAVDVSHILAIMAVAVGLRWVASMYRAGLVGLERQALVNLLAVGFATLRFIGVLIWIPVMRHWPIVFFAHQVGVGLLEVVTYRTLIHRGLPARSQVPRFSFDLFRELAPLAGAMALLGVIWVLATQFDKLVLSRLLSLAEYGYYSIAVMAAGGVLMLMPPLNQVLQPRMTILAMHGNEEKLRHLYRVTTQLLAATFAAVGAAMALLPAQLLYAWSGNHALATSASPILEIYAPAYSCAALLSLPFLLQFAYGKLRLHVWGNVLLLAFLLPALVLCAEKWGAVGAGATLCVAYAAFLLLWVPLIHHRFLPGLAFHWLLVDVAPPAGVAVAVAFLVSMIVPSDAGRIVSACGVVVAAGAGGLAGLFTGNLSRMVIFELLGSRV